LLFAEISSQANDPALSFLGEGVTVGLPSPASRKS
jgi:hypothetical protein